MINYTTPFFELEVLGIDISDKEIYVTIEQEGVETTITEGLTVSFDVNTIIQFHLSQKQSAQFKPNKTTLVQVNWKDGEYRFATDKAKIDVEENLLDRVV